MFTRNDLLNHPEKYQPLGSVKAIMNKACEVDFTDIDLNAVFKSQSNIIYMSNKLYKVYRQNGGRSTIEKIRSLISKLAYDFSIKNNLNSYQVSEIGATGINNWVESLKTINNQFTKHCYNWFKWNNFVPTREWVEVGPINDRKQVRFNEIQAPDKQTIDVWEKQEIQLINSHFRHNNKIPFWQKTMNTRHYDRGNEGLQENDSDRSSLDTPIYGYNMKPIYSAMNKWQSEDWFGVV
jgi:hypothetical protein